MALEDPVKLARGLGPNYLQVMVVDAHLHLYDLSSHDPYCWEEIDGKVLCVTNMHEPGEWDFAQSKIRSHGSSRTIGHSFGIHPQLPIDQHWELLQGLVGQGKLCAVGEAGFDLFDSHYRSTEKEQERVFDMQLQLAIEGQLPMILHVRRALHKIFPLASQLAQLPSVVFHSWPGPLREAESLLNKGINCYFSFGQPIIQGNKKARSSVAGLPGDRILLETDAPWQRLAHQSFTPWQTIEQVYDQAAQLCSMDRTEIETQVEANFRAAYPGHPINGVT